jgi:aerobic carbon-monoxide dehydrogenase small subunit
MVRRRPDRPGLRLTLNVHGGSIHLKQGYQLTVNGVERSLEAEPSQTLLDALRDDLGLTGSKKGCNEGECASCTVLLDGIPVNSCLVLLPDARGKHVVTIEGIEWSGDLHPVQQAMVDLGGIQCGYCTPGFVVSACALLAENPNPTADEVKFYLAGNICRCTGYNKIVAAVQEAASQLRSAGSSLARSAR